jgi:hypothetical protein
MKKLLALAFVGIFAASLIGGCRGEAEIDTQTVVSPAR